MFTTIKRYSQFLFLLAVLASCSKQNGFGPNYDAYSGGTVPVSVQNSVDNRPDPTVTASLGGDSSIKVILTIPSGIGRSIKEITKVVTNSSYTAIQGSGASYIAAPIAGNGTTVTFTTSVREYMTKNPATKPADIKVNTELANRYYFRLTLDDGSIVYPTPVRVLLLQ